MKYGVAAACVVLLGVAVSDGQERPPLTPEAWLKAVEAHEPGTADQAALDVGLASTNDLRVVLEVMADLAGRGATNATLERGAWLHADILLLVPDSGGPGFDGRRRGVALALDGRGLGWHGGSRHLEFAWALLGLVEPSPAGNAAVRRWYQAIGAVLLGLSQLGDASMQLSDARRLFPNEAWTVLDLGCLNETWATPGVQQVVRGWRAEPRPAIASERTHLGRAEQYFKEAIEMDPHFVEARLRLGRVIGLQWHHDDAVRELERVIDAAPDPILQYYAHLFLGHEQEALGHPDAARGEYQRAAALYPRAQSPQLALSHLASVGGDRAAALDAVHRILELPAAEAGREDPWWVYHLGRGRDADAMLDEARREPAGGGR